MLRIEYVAWPTSITNSVLLLVIVAMPNDSAHNACALSLLSAHALDWPHYTYV